MEEGSPSTTDAAAAALLVAAAVTLTSVALASAAAAADSGEPVMESGEPRIVELYPDTPEHRHTGEYVAVEFPEPTDTTGWKLEDRYRDVELPNDTLEGRVVFGREGSSRDHSIGTVRLAADGDNVTLRSPAGVVDSVSYGGGDADAPASDAEAPDPDEGEVLELTEDGWRSQHVDATEFTYEVYEVDAAETYVTPDAGYAALDALENAEDSVDIAGFRFTSTAVADALVDVVDGGGSVDVLLEGGPPGGFGEDSAEAVDPLAAAGADVTLYRGGSRPYRYMHAKYAVVDREEAVVSSENWHAEAVTSDAEGPRGWGVVLYGDGPAEHLSELHKADRDASSMVDWSEGGFETYERSGFGSKSPDTAFEARNHSDVDVGVYTAPEEAVEQTARLLSEADGYIYVQQAYVRNWSTGGNPFVDELLEAAERGVDVKLQMDGRWYVEDDNRRMKQRLNDAAEAGNLSLEARLSEEALHNKGFVVDGEHAVVSSVNWNENSPTENREVAVVLEDEDAAAYYEEVFLTDWRRSDADSEPEGPPDVYLQILVAVFAAGAGVYLVFRRTR